MKRFLRWLWDLCHRITGRRSSRPPALESLLEDYRNEADALVIRETDKYLTKFSFGRPPR